MRERALGTRRGARRGLAVGLTVLVCAALVGSAAAAPASGGRHLPYFSVMNERVAIKELPTELRFSFGGLPGVRDFRGPNAPTHGPVWFGEVERPKATIEAAGTRRWVCVFEEPRDRFARGGGGGCTTLAAMRELDLQVGSCGKGPPRQFRIDGLVPDGVTGLAIERSDGTIGRTVPVHENTVAFNVDRGDITLHGVGDAAAGKLERSLPLGTAGRLGGGGGGCSFYTFAEARPGK